MKAFHLAIQVQVKLILLLALTISDDHPQMLLVYLDVYPLFRHVLGKNSNFYYSLCLKPLVPATGTVHLPANNHSCRVRLPCWQTSTAVERGCNAD